ncbi:hypothetical protein CY34DRAFT_753676 [Suillus luteus UH-Slu-Lm8-n1]|uniref:Uncharacterized protein n=1 Tax=Suillus luteus UH-Slu-Lm8-n1 TaxID=930992 RepID=A0A0D0ALG4_9AGAM|nr:hypothetical protein CY34DRAFT_753676 [Suillus luteus UH-Slu-Lm8-n1]
MRQDAVRCGKILRPLQTDASDLDFSNFMSTFESGLRRQNVLLVLGLSWGSRGPVAALEELCRMTNNELESLPDIQPFTMPMLGKLAFLLHPYNILSRPLHFSHGRTFTQFA